jgi:hypothetical protein
MEGPTELSKCFLIIEISNPLREELRNGFGDFLGLLDEDFENLLINLFFRRCNRRFYSLFC